MRFDAASVFRSPAFFVLLAIGVFNAWGGLWFSTGEWYGTEVFPVTRLMVQALQDAFTHHPDHHRHLLRRRAGLARPRAAHARDRRRHRGARLGAPGAQDRRRRAACWWPRGPGRARHRVVVQLLKGYTQFEIGHYLLWFLLPRPWGRRSWRCSRSSCRCWCRTR
jgi:ABC-2 type transport system permease protein